MKLFFPVLCLIIAGTIFFWYINPTYTLVRASLAQESQYDEALSKARELQNVRDQLIARDNTFSQTDLGRLQKLLPDSIDNVRLTLDLDSMASRYGMRVRNVTIDTSGNMPSGAAIANRQQIGPSSQAYESVVISFSVSGSYDVFRQYLASLEKSLRLGDVTGISFAPNDTGIYNYTIHLKTYWLKP
jgi:hypothetical protein